MNLIERAVKALEEAEQARQAGQSPSMLPVHTRAGDPDRDFVVPDTMPAASTQAPQPTGDDGIPVLGEDSVTDSVSGSPSTGLARDTVRQARMRALREKIDQVEASDEQADVSMPAAVVRATRAAGSTGLLVGAGAAGSAAAGQSRSPADRAGAVATPSGGRPAESAAPAGQNQGSTWAGTAATAHEADAPILRLAPIRASAYLDPALRADPMRAAFEAISDDLIDEMTAADGLVTPTGRRIAVTSSVVGEGRGLCSLHLALSLAVDQGMPVVWVDADPTGEPVLASLGVRAGPGLADWLSGQVRTLGALLVPSGIAGLRLVGKGTSAALASTGARLDQAAIHDFLLALSEVCPEDLIVLKLPPLLGGRDAMEVAALVGHTVVVVAADSTTRSTLKRALAELQRQTTVSLLLNKVAA